MTTFRLAIADFCDPTLRCVAEFAAAHTLQDVHDLAVREFDLPDNGTWAFYLSGKWFDAATEVSLRTPARTPRQAALASLGLAARRRFVLVYDGDDGPAFKIEVHALGEEQPGAAYPAVLEHPNLCGDGGEPGPFDEALLQRLEKTLYPPGPPQPCASCGGVHGAKLPLDDELALARLALAACPDAQRLQDLDDAVGVDSVQWLLRLAQRLGEGLRTDEALEMLDAVAARVPDTDLRADRAAALASGGRTTQAMELLQTANEPPGPQRDQLNLLAAELEIGLGHHAAAEGILRALLAQDGVGGVMRVEAMDGLVRALEAQGKRDEARKLRSEHRHLSEQQGREDAALLLEPYERAAPKVGRNDPCPCGSGKKFKKCCGQ